MRAPAARRADRPRRAAAQAGRHPVRAQRLRARARHASACAATSLEIWPAYAGDGPAGRALRRRGRGDRRASTRSPARCSTTTRRTWPIYPATHYVTSEADDRAGAASRSGASSSERCALSSSEHGKLLEAHRLRQRTHYDMEMMREMGFCNGHRELLAHPATASSPGARPYCLLDYFPDDFLCFIDESHHDGAADRRHVRGRPLAQADAGRLRLPAARARSTTGRCASTSSSQRVPQIVFVSRHAGRSTSCATAVNVVEQIIRPTGLVDPEVEVRADRRPDRRPHERDPRGASSATSACW